MGFTKARKLPVGVSGDAERLNLPSPAERGKEKGGWVTHPNHIEPVEIPGLKIGDLVNGVSYKAKDISMLLNNEEVIKEACQSFKNYLEVMASFGGEEVIEYT